MKLLILHSKFVPEETPSVTMRSEAGFEIAAFELWSAKILNSLAKSERRELANHTSWISCH